MALALARPAFCETQPNLPSPTYVVHIPSQVWDLSSGKLVLTFPANGRVSVEDYPSLSNSGHFVCANRAQDLEIFSVPMAEK